MNTAEKTKKIKWDNYTACAYAEGFCEGEEATAREKIEAFAYIAKTGLYKSLQGFYGRAINSLVERGVMDWSGNINEEVVAELLDEDRD